MNLDTFWFLTFLITIPALSLGAKGGGRGKGKGKGKNLLPFANVNEYSMVIDQKFHPKGAKITRASHFAQTYKLGYKILLVCVAEGDPLPQIKWFKDGMELPLKKNTHLYEEPFRKINKIKSKIEIDPATVGDQGIYTCMANNRHSVMVKNFKTEYYY